MLEILLKSGLCMQDGSIDANFKKEGDEDADMTDETV